MSNEYRGNRWYKCDLHLHTLANGDAELIVAMDSNSRYVKVYKSGGIEDE